MQVEVFPEIEIDNKYSKIKLPKTIVNIDDKEVDVALEDIKIKFTKFEKTAK
jgi:FKBP-type peptidyl-prolyl cis-trans isomerase (trigger factor)